MYLDAPSAKLLGHLLRRAFLLEGDFRMRMDVAAKCGQLSVIAADVSDRIGHAMLLN